MAINFYSLEDAALKLGVSTDELVEMRSRGEIFGYRDGTSWKFKPEEIERVAAELQGDVLDDDEFGEGSSLLVSDTSSSKTGSTLGGDKRASTSDLRLADDDGSDVSLVADPGSGSDVKLVAGRSGLKSSQDDLQLVDDSEGSDVPLSMAGGSGLSLAGSEGSDVLAGSDLDLGLEDLSSGGSANVLSGDSNVAIGSSGSLDLDDGDLELADDDDLVLGGGGSDLALATDSGINLMSPSDSGISLEDVPLDLAGSGISGLSLGSEVGSGSKASASGSGSFVDFQQDEEFQLSPSGDMEMDDDSSSQVIELEDSTEFGDAAVALPADGDAFGMGMGMGGDGFGAPGVADDSMLGTGRAPAPAMVGTPEIPFSTSQVMLLLTSLLVMCMSGILVTDIVRNMWAWSGETSDLTSGFTDLVTSSLGMK